MTKLAQTTGNKNFLLNDRGNLITIKQPSISELKILYLTIMHNKKLVSTIFGGSEPHK